MKGKKKEHDIDPNLRPTTGVLTLRPVNLKAVSVTRETLGPGNSSQQFPSTGETLGPGNSSKQFPSYGNRSSNTSSESSSPEDNTSDWEPKKDGIESDSEDSTKPEISTMGGLRAQPGHHKPKRMRTRRGASAEERRTKKIKTNERYRTTKQVCLGDLAIQMEEQSRLIKGLMEQNTKILQLMETILNILKS